MTYFGTVPQRGNKLKNHFGRNVSIAAIKSQGDQRSKLSKQDIQDILNEIAEQSMRYSNPVVQGCKIIVEGPMNQSWPISSRQEWEKIKQMYDEIFGPINWHKNRPRG